MGRSRRSQLVLAAVALGGLVDGRARAGDRAPPPPPVLVHVDGDCPDVASLVRALAAVLPDRGVRTDAGSDGGEVPPVEALVLVEDLGGQYRVTAAGRSRAQADPRRDCAERTRSVAVYAALMLDPPHVLVEDRATSGPAAARAPHLPVALLAAGLLDVAPRTGQEPGPWLIGGGLRLQLGGARVGLALGAAVLAPGEMTSGGVRVRLLRAPIDASLRLVLRTGRIGLAVEAGGAAIPTLAEGIDLARNQRDGGVELGVRAALEVSVAATARLHAVAAVQTLWLPLPARLDVDPRGTVGTTPSWWIGLWLGAAWRFR